MYIACVSTVQKHILFYEQDVKAVEEIRLRYGLDTFTQALRMAVRLAVNQPRLKATTPRAPQSRSKREWLKLGNVFQNDSFDITPEQFQAKREQFYQQRRKHLLSKTPRTRSTNLASNNKSRATKKAQI
jgi:hypothetical protein